MLSSILNPCIHTLKAFQRTLSLWGRGGGTVTRLFCGVCVGLARSPHVNEWKVVRKGKIVLPSYSRHGGHYRVVRKGAIKSRHVPSEEKVLGKVASRIVVDTATREKAVAQAPERRTCKLTGGFWRGRNLRLLLSRHCKVLVNTSPFFLSVRGARGRKMRAVSRSCARREWFTHECRNDLKTNSGKGKDGTKFPFND